MRQSPILLFSFLISLFLVGCSSSGERSLSSEEKQKLIEVHTESAQQYLNMGELDRAEGQTEKGLALDPQNKKLKLILGMTLLKRGQSVDLMRAEGVFKALDPDGDYQTSVGLGATLERLAILHRQSATDIRSGKHLTQAADPEQRAREFESRAKTYLQEARTSFERSLQRKPDNIDGLNGLVRTAALLGDEEASLSNAEKLIGILREDRRFWETSLVRPEISSEEEARFRKLARAQSDLEIAARLHAATLAHKLGREQRAIDHLNGVIELKPDLAEAYSRRAEGQMSLGRYREAHADLDSFLRLSAGRKSDDPDIKRAYSLMSECERKVREASAAR